MIKTTNRVARNILETVYYTAMPSYESDGIDPYSDLPVKFPRLKRSFLPHIMFPTEVDKNRSRIGTHYVFLFFKTIIQTIQQYRHLFSDLPPLELFWSEKHIDSATQPHSLIVEHGWLPRSSYQISNSGANGRGAPDELKKDESYLETYGGEANLFKRLELIKKAYLSNAILLDKNEFDDGFIVAPFQIGNDLNLRDSSTKFAKYYGFSNSTHLFVSEFVETINDYDLPLPVYFTQHPVDREDHKINLRKNDQFFSSTSKVSTLSLIRHPNCRGIISVNSNVVHEALCLNTPCCVLGRLFWRDGQDSPFESDPVRFFNKSPVHPHDDPAIQEYLAKLLCHQWYLSDFQNPLIIRELMINRATLLAFKIRKNLSLM